jgi:hypothetical protein
MTETHHNLARSSGREHPMRTATVVLALLLSTIGVVPGFAHGGHHGMHLQNGEHSMEGDSDAGRGHGRGNSAYNKAKVEERDRLLSKLKDICRGC